MVELSLILMFLMAISTPLMALISELYHKTPNGVIYSTIRSLICIGSILFIAVMLNPLYMVSLFDFASVSLIFSISLIQFICEIKGRSTVKILSVFFKDIQNNQIEKS